MEDVVYLKPWEVHEFAWGSAIKHTTGKWEKVFIKPDGQQLDVSHLNVELHENGIELKEVIT